MKENNKNDNSNKYVLISFQSSHHAIRGEKAAEVTVANININKTCEDKTMRLIPIPPEISAGCGLVLQLPFSLLQLILDAFNNESIAFEDVFVVECEGKATYTKLSLQ